MGGLLPSWMYDPYWATAYMSCIGLATICEARHQQTRTNFNKFALKFVYTAYHLARQSGGYGHAPCFGVFKSILGQKFVSAPFRLNLVIFLFFLSLSLSYLRFPGSWLDTGG